MRILVVTPAFLPILGGVETGIFEIYKRLGKHHDVRILTVSRGEEVKPISVGDNYYSSDNFEVCYFKDLFRFVWSKVPGIIREMLPPFSPFYIPATLKNIREFRPDVINFHYAAYGGLSLILTRMLTNVPIVLSLVSRQDVFRENSSLLGQFRNLYLTPVIKSAHAIASNSKYYLNCYRGNRDREKIIPYGVDMQRFSPEANGDRIRNNLGITPHCRILFTLQRLAKIKRIDLLIKSMQHIIQTQKNVMLMIGGKGPELDSLKALTEKLNLNSNVIFTGYISEADIPDYFAAADIFAFSSPDETFGVVLAQAMAAGKPVVAFNASAIPEVVDNGITGTLVDSLDPREYARAVVELLNDKQVMEKYSKNGRQKALEHYDWNLIAEQYEGMFNDLLKKDPKKQAANIPHPL